MTGVIKQNAKYQNRKKGTGQILKYSVRQELVATRRNPESFASDWIVQVLRDYQLQVNEFPSRDRLLETIDGAKMLESAVLLHLKSSI